MTHEVEEAQVHVKRAHGHPGIVSLQAEADILTSAAHPGVVELVGSRGCGADG